MYNMKVYLAGGFYSGWQERVIESRPDEEYYDPRTQFGTSPEEYTEWDLDHIEMCNVLICYIEKSNPGVSNCSLEVGYAAGVGAAIIVIDERQEPYYEMIKEVADQYFASFDEFLKVWSKG